MKHPNRKSELQNKWLCEFHKQIRRSREKSCFNFWMDAEITSRLKVPLTHKTLIEALANFDRNNNE